MKKRLISLLLAVISILSLVSCKTREGYLELGLDIPEAYEKQSLEDTFDAAYTDGVSVIGIARLSFEAAIDDGIVETLSPEGFAKYYRQRIGKEDAALTIAGDVPYIVYEGGEEEKYTYLVAFYRSRYAYFVVTFATGSEYFSSCRAEYIEIATSAYLDYNIKRK